MSSGNTTSSEASATAPRVCAILDSDGSEIEFDAFEIDAVDGQGATLRGPLLFEVGEELSLRFDVAPQPVRVRADVVAASLEDETTRVSFKALPDADRQRLAAGAVG